jgi:hypothetical protein
MRYELTRRDPIVPPARQERTPRRSRQETLRGSCPETDWPTVLGSTRVRQKATEGTLLALLVCLAASALCTVAITAT